MTPVKSLFAFAALVVPLLAAAADKPANTFLEKGYVQRVPLPRATPLTVTRADGGAVQTALPSGLVENKASSLRREWLTLHDTAMPADILGTPGVATVSVPEPASGELRYQVKVPLVVREALSAVEVRILTFDVWGEHTRTLLLDEVKDVPPGKLELAGGWRLASPEECSRFYASIAYVARVRTTAGRVVVADPTAVVAEVRKVSPRFQKDDLEEKREARLP